jgi:paraquat-inducible protein A
MKPKLVADCPRCGHVLWRMRRYAFEMPIAMSLAALLFYIVAIWAPFLEISLYGRSQLATLETGPAQLSLQGFEPVGILVGFVTILVPGFKLGVILLTLLGLKTRLLPAPLLKRIFRFYKPIGPWAMIDVYLLGFLVAFTRLTAIASVHLDTALYSLIGLMIAMAATDAALDDEAVWRALDEADDHARLDAQAADGPLIGCHCCGLVNEPAADCRRCGAALRWRKPESIPRSWAFVLGAVCLYIPANMYPVMMITQLGNTRDFTIMGGIVELASYGLWPLALLVFIASITIPLMKLLALIYMLILTQTGSDEHLLGRIKAYRFINFIGRWSMIDVFMISILVALVRFARFANIQADVGATCFAAVVVLTIFAVDSFDPRLMWDVTGETQTPPANAGSLVSP